MRPKYHDGAIVLIAALLRLGAASGMLCVVQFHAGGRRDPVAAAEQSQREAETMAAMLLDQLDRWQLLPEGMAAPVDLGEYLCTAYCAEEYPHICGG